MGLNWKRLAILTLLGGSVGWFIGLIVPRLFDHSDVGIIVALLLALGFGVVVGRIGAPWVRGDY